MSRQRSGDPFAGSGFVQAKLDIVLGGPAEPHRGREILMRFFDNWWEHVPTVARYAPLVLAILSIVFARPLDYYWE
jgi:hypothetical protein